MPSKIDALAAGDVHGRHFVFLGNLGDRRSSAGVVSPPHMRGITE